MAFYDFLFARPFGTIPIWSYFVIIGIAFVLYKIFKRFKPQPKIEPYKPIELKKEIFKDLEKLTDSFSERVNGSLRLKTGFVSIGYIQNAMKLAWDFKVDVKQNLKRNFLKTQSKKIKERIVKEEKKIASEEKIKALKLVYVFKYYGFGKISFIKSILGLGFKYLIVDNELTQINTNEIVISSNSNPSTLFGIFIISKASEKVIEQIVYKLAYETALTSFVNSIPKQSYLEERTARIVAELREKAEIEKTKYAGQLEGAQT
jgi:hypothetical protein